MTKRPPSSPKVIKETIAVKYILDLKNIYIYLYSGYKPLKPLRFVAELHRLFFYIKVEFSDFLVLIEQL